MNVCGVVYIYLLTYLFTYIITNLITYLLTCCMVQSPYCQSNWFATSQDIPRIHGPKISIPHSQASVTCLYPVPFQSSPYTHIPIPGDPS